MNKEKDSVPEVDAESNSLAKSDNMKSDSAIDLRNLFIEELKYVYWMEKLIAKEYPRLIINASTENLIITLISFYEIDKDHVNWIEDVFELLGKKPRAKKCEAIDGLVKEAEVIMKETKKGVMRDEGIILSCQKIKHYQIASYGTLCSFARALRENEIGILLQRKLDRTYESDEQLTEIAESLQEKIQGINK